MPLKSAAPSAPGRRRIRLVWSLLAVMLATSLLPLFITAYILIDINRESLESATREYQLQLAASLASRLDAAIASGQGHAREAAASVTRAIARDTAARNQPDEIRSLIQPHLTEPMRLLRYTSASGSLVQVGSADGLDPKVVQQAFFDVYAMAM